MYGTHAELAARGVDTNALLGLLQEGEDGTGKDKCKWKIHWLFRQTPLEIHWDPKVLLWLGVSFNLKEKGIIGASTSEPHSSVDYREEVIRNPSWYVRINQLF